MILKQDQETRHLSGYLGFYTNMNYEFWRIIFIPRLQTPVALRSENNKALVLSQQGFIFVAKCGEISNLDLIRDIDRIIKLDEVYQWVHQPISG